MDKCTKTVITIVEPSGNKHFVVSENIFSAKDLRVSAIMVDSYEDLNKADLVAMYNNPKGAEPVIEFVKNTLDVPLIEASAWVEENICNITTEQYNEALTKEYKTL